MNMYYKEGQGTVEVLSFRRYISYMGSEVLVSHRSERKKFLIRALSWRTLEPFPSTAAMHSVFHCMCLEVADIIIMGKF